MVHPGLGYAESLIVFAAITCVVGGTPHIRHSLPLPLCYFLRESEDVIAAMVVAKFGLKKAPAQPQSDLSQPGPHQHRKPRVAAATDSGVGISVYAQEPPRVE